MADIKISALPGASTLTGAETIPLVQGGTTKKVTSDQFLIKDASGNVGVGTASPGAKLEVSSSGANIRLRSTDTYDAVLRYYVNGVEAASARAKSNLSYVIETAGLERVRIDASGNLGLGVTPSAWVSGARAVDIGQYCGIWQDASGYPGMGFNAYQAVGTGWTYKTTGNPATRTSQTSGAFQWYTAPSGTAGNPISFTQAMTLDASGDLTTANGRINLITVGRGGGGVASNTASGYQALYSNTTGYNNTASGYAALYFNTTGNGNTASGHQALHYNTTGVNNTASGLNSGFNPDNDIAQYRITTDFDMTLVGYGATKDNAGQLWNSTAIGARAKVTKSNQVVLGDSNVTETLINGDLVQKVSTTAATLTANGTLTFSIVNDTTLRISVRGSDGTTRTATVALS